MPRKTMLMTQPTADTNASIDNSTFMPATIPRAIRKRIAGEKINVHPSILNIVLVMFFIILLLR
jgi:hypothetical protein